MWLGKVGDVAFLASPTDDGRFMAAVVPSIERRDELRGAREAGYDEGLTHWPELHACVAGAKRVGPVQMMSRWHGFFRESAGPGWALVGDAGHFKDPSPGQGISDALRQVVELAPAIERTLGGDDGALAEWWAWRDRDAWEMYWFAHDLGAPGETPLVLREMQRRIAADPRLTDGLLRVLNHDAAPSEVFTRRIALAAMAQAFARNPGRRRQVLGEVRALLGAQVRRDRAAP
jgi:2-polyprenyl-6-methoxyphenol hydroxylase-like FAD-dependent oxidoreductase